MTFSKIWQCNGYYEFMISWSVYKGGISVANLSSEELDFVKLIDDFISTVNSQIEN